MYRELEKQGKNKLDDFNWNVKQNPAPGQKVGVNDVGYCTHGTPLFLPWHRCYQQMMEQAVYAKMIELAATFTFQQQEYMNAAATFRFPYWDSLRPRAGVYGAAEDIVPGVIGKDNRRERKFGSLTFCLPYIVSTKFVKVTRPNGAEDYITNPLYQYNFPTKAALQDPNKGIGETKGSEFIDRLENTYPGVSPRFQISSFNHLNRLYQDFPRMEEA
jgi:hypothetical protein